MSVQIESKMNYVLILVLIFVTTKIDAKSLRFKRDLEGAEAETCIRELHLNKDEIQEINNLDHAPENHQHYIQFLECFWRRKGYLRQNADIDYDEIRHMIDDIFEEDLNSGFSRNIADNVLSKCKNIEGTSPGQKAVKLKNCLMKNLHDVIDQ